MLEFTQADLNYLFNQIIETQKKQWQEMTLMMQQQNGYDAELAKIRRDGEERMTNLVRWVDEKRKPDGY